MDIFSLCLTLCVLSTVTLSMPQKAAPPVNLGRPFEKFTNQTLDEIITGAMGGVDVASNMILADNGHILAELDMYLTKEQFLGMYQPPKPEDMIKMGMMPAPIGAPPMNDGHVQDFTEDLKGNGVRQKRKATRNVRLRWTYAEIPYLFAKGHF
ncbi:unnamed protein product, partial [Candidula unifasciata]